VQRYYDKTGNHLLYFGQKATPEFWDRHWQTHSRFGPVIEKNSFVIKTTQKFLKKGRILEGGCGTGRNMHSLHRNGYSAFGVDFARETVKKANKHFPELNIDWGDVRSLQFDDCFFDGYWSLGVIEHFFEGYNPALKEMNRVVKKGGYVFLAFPYMAPLRRAKAKLGFYENSEKAKPGPKNFYQFALNPQALQANFEKNGFALKYSKPFDGLKGFKDEVLIFKPFLQKLYVCHIFQPT